MYTSHRDIIIIMMILIAGNTNNHFQIDHTSGLISTTVFSIDREIEDMYTLTVTATDNDLRTVSFFHLLSL